MKDNQVGLAERFFSIKGELRSPSTAGVVQHRPAPSSAELVFHLSPGGSLTRRALALGGNHPANEHPGVCDVLAAARGSWASRDAAPRSRCVPRNG